MRAGANGFLMNTNDVGRNRSVQKAGFDSEGWSGTSIAEYLQISRCTAFVYLSSSTYDVLVGAAKY